MDANFFRHVGIIPRFFEDRIKGNLYRKPGDFVVQELFKNKICTISNENRTAQKKSATRFIHATLVKKNTSTFDACSTFAKANSLEYFSDVSYCGLKDTLGVTAQRICFKNTGKLTKTRFPRFFLKDFSCSNSPLTIGMHTGNRFLVKITRLQTDPKKAEELLRAFSKRIEKGIPNFYGPQRFGIRQNNHQLGKLLLQKKYSDFIWQFLTYSKNETSSIRRIRKKLEKNFGNWNKCLKIIGKNTDLSDEKTLVEHLSFGYSELDAIKKVKISGFCIHSYSSYLFNLALSEFINKKHKNIQLEKIGEHTRFNQLNKKLFLPVLEKEGIAITDFNQKEKLFCVPHHFRNTLFYPKNFEYEIHKKEINLKFDLGKGEYASFLLDFIVETDFEKLN